MNGWMGRTARLLAMAAVVAAVACTESVEEASAEFCESVVELRRDLADVSTGTAQTTTVGEIEESVQEVASDVATAREHLEDVEEAVADEVADAHAELERSLDEIDDDMSIDEARTVANAALEQMDAALESAAAQLECPAS